MCFYPSAERHAALIGRRSDHRLRILCLYRIRVNSSRDDVCSDVARAEAAFSSKDLVSKGSNNHILGFTDNSFVG